MKKTFKRIISLLLTFCMVFPLMLTTPVSAYNIYLEEFGYIYDWTTLYFTPDESGFYQFTLSPDGEAMDGGFASIYDENYCYIPLLFEVAHHNDATMYGGMSISYFCYFEQGERYVFEISPGNNIWGGLATTNYHITKAYVNDIYDYSIGETKEIEINCYELSVVHCTADETNQAMFSIDQQYFNVYDVNNKITVGDGYNNQLTFDAVEGNEYYAVITSNEFSPVNANLSSAYLELTDNTPVITSNIDEMQSSHPYQNNLDKSWTYNAPDGTIYNEITFNSSTRLAYYDFLYVYDADGNMVKEYKYWDSIYNKTLTVPGGSFTIKLVTDSSNIEYGFGFSSINSYSKIPTPKASVESGTIRPSQVTVTGNAGSTIYYKISTEDNEGTYAKYTSAISINETSTLSLYAQIGDYTSDVVTYNYVVNNAAVQPPVFNVKSSTSTSVELTITASEGDVYYKRMTNNSSYTKLAAGRSVYVSTNDVIVAYAMSGTLKSEYVYYACNFTDNSQYELVAPVITETPVLGGKTVTISVPNEFEYKNSEQKINYGYSHSEYDCGMMEEYSHEMGPWSYEYENTYTYVFGRNADEKVVANNYYNASEFPKTYTVYQNTVFTAQNNYEHNSESGQWCSYEMGYNEYWHDLSDMMYGEDPNYSQDYYFYYSPKSYLYAQVPKANVPVFVVNDGKLEISAGEGELIYYTLNDGTEVQYTSPLNVKNGDIINAYAIGMGIAKSDIEEYVVELSGVTIKSTAVLGGYEVEIVGTNATDTIYCSTDGSLFNLYEEKLFVTEDMTIYAYSVCDGEQTETKSVTVIVPKASAPVPSHISGEYIKGTELSFTGANTNDEIYYTIAEATTKYTGALTLNENIKISVYAIGIGIAKSDITDYEYSVLVINAPEITEDDIFGGKLISMATKKDGTNIYYSINDGEYVVYTEPFEVYDITKINAYVDIEGVGQSDVIEYNVTMVQTADPVPNYASGEVFGGTKIELVSFNDDRETVIYYTIDNTNPTNESIAYTDGIVISSPVTIKAIAYAKGYAASEIVTLNYTLRVTKKPQITEQNTKGGKKIYIESQTENSLVYYTVDGTDPKTSETAVLYEAPFVVGESGTIVRAYAKADGYLESDAVQHIVEIGQLPVPVLSIAEEEVFLNTELTITADEFADIYYTHDGTEPTIDSYKYVAPIIITDDVTVKAIAVAEGWQISEIAQKSYKIYTTGSPYIVKTKNGDKMKIELKSETPDVTIYYTLDGTQPTDESPVYSKGILLSKDTVVKAFAVAERRKSSDVLTETVLVRHTADPVVGIPSGEIKRTDKITITANENAKIFYTLDGNEPTEESLLYTAPISIKSNTILKVFAVEDGFLDSNVGTYEYTIKRAKNPEISLNKDILGGKSIKIESAEQDVLIYYTTDGTIPTVNSLLYEQPFNIYETTVISAIAVLEGCDNSDVVYREIAVPVADIIRDGSYYSFLRDAYITTNLSSQIVYYTLDYSEPTLESGIYEPGKIKVSDDSISMKAFAIGEGYAKSEVVTVYFYVTSCVGYISVKHGDNEAEVTLSSSPSFATIYYTLDGSSPSLETNPNRVLYSEPFKVTENVTLNIYVTADRYLNTYKTEKIYVNKAKEPKLKATEPSYTLYGTTYIKSGSYVTLNSPDGVNIRYTLDGTVPDAENGIEYTEPILINENKVIKAYCYGEDFDDSLVESYNVKIFNVLGSVITKNVYGGKEIEIEPLAGANERYSTYMTESFKDFTVYYTLDGTEPTTENAHIYMQIDSEGEYVVKPPEKIFTDKDVTVKVYVVAENCISADAVSEDITVKKLNKPSFLPAETEVYKNSYITLESAEANALIYYTLDGTEPTMESQLYEGPFIIDDDTTIKMIALKEGMATSDMAVANYTVKRTKTPSYTTKMSASGMVVTLDCETENARIYYTVNGDTPTENATIYNAPFKLKKNTVLKFIAVSDNMKNSYVVSELIDVPTAQMSIVGISDVTVAKDGYAEAMLYLHNNPGIEAYSISVEYDDSILTPVSAENLMGGIFTTNIDKGEKSGVENAVSMVWLGNESRYEDCDAVKLVFKVNETAQSQTTPLYIKENGVINHLYEMVDVAYMDGSVTITDEISSREFFFNGLYSGKTQYTDTKLGMTTSVTDNKLTVNVVVDENSGIGAYNISMLYDNNALTPISVENGELFISDVMSNVTQPGADLSDMSEITVLSCNDKNATENGVLYTITFDINTNYDVMSIGFSDVMLVDVNGNEVIGIYEDSTVKNEIKTVTKIENGNVIITPFNVPSGSSIVVAGYDKDILAFSKIFDNDGEIISFEMPDLTFDTIKVFIFENLLTIKPLSTIIDTVVVQ